MGEVLLIIRLYDFETIDLRRVGEYLLYLLRRLQELRLQIRYDMSHVLCKMDQSEELFCFRSYDSILKK